MAKAKKSGIAIRLELFAEEASVLRSVLGHVGGNPKGLRGLADATARALENAGVVPIGAPCGGIKFSDEEKSSDED